MWLSDKNFVKEVTEVWRALPPIHLLPKLLEVSSFMARWGKTFFHKFRKKIKEHKANLDKLVDCTDHQSMQDYISEKKKLNQLLSSEETYWKQRAKLFWLKEGDENTRFFHSSATAREKANRISFLLNNEGDRVEDHEGMCRIVCDYFTTLFTDEDHIVEDTRTAGHRTITAYQNTSLIEDLH